MVISCMEMPMIQRLQISDVDTLLNVFLVLSHTLTHFLSFFLSFEQLLECDPHFVLCYRTLTVPPDMCFLSVVLVVCVYQRLRSLFTLCMTLAL